MLLSTQYVIAYVLAGIAEIGEKQIGNDAVISVIDIVVIIRITVVIDVPRIIVIVVIRRTKPPITIRLKLFVNLPYIDRRSG